MLESRPSQLRLVAVVGAAITALGVSAPLIRAMDAGPLAIAAWRTTAAAAILAVPAWRAARPTNREHAALAAAGICLGAHFALWFASLSATTVLRSTVLVCLAPIWAGLIEAGVDRDPPPIRFWLGAGVAVVGSALLAGGDLGGGRLSGDALALVAGFLWPIYLRLTRSYRNRAGSLAAMGHVCRSAAIVCALAALAWGDPLIGWDTRTWLLLAAAVALPQLVGHQGLAWAVAWVPASRLSAATLLEPVIAAGIAAALFGERPGPAAVVGAAVVLAGVWICVGGGSPQSAPAGAPPPAPVVERAGRR